MSDVPEEIKVTGNEKWLRSFRYAPQGGTLTRVQLLIAQLVACGLSDRPTWRRLLNGEGSQWFDFEVFRTLAQDSARTFHA